MDENEASKADDSAAVNRWEREQQEDRERAIALEEHNIEISKRTVQAYERQTAILENVSSSYARLAGAAHAFVNLAANFLADFHTAYEDRTAAYRERNEQIGRFVDSEVAPLFEVPQSIEGRDQ